MLFNSIHFAVFLPFFFVLYWLLQRLPLRVQNSFVLLGSFLFYGWWDWRFLSLIVVSSLVDFLVPRPRPDGGLGPAEAPAAGQPRHQPRPAGLLQVLRLLPRLLRRPAGHRGPAGEPVEPGHHPDAVGISFYTFQTLSYTIDVYRRKIPSCRDPIAFFAFVSFFPQLVAGPIERAKSLLPQFQRERTFDLTAARDGCRQILWGFVKKVLIADNMAGHVETIFSQSDSLPGPVPRDRRVPLRHPDLRGLLGLLGHRARDGPAVRVLPDAELRVPVLLADIAEFWRRWHISLSTWFRDYVYMPLCGVKPSRNRRGVMIVVLFVICGLWHGAGWTYVFWGLLHGLYFLPITVRKRQKRYLGVAGSGALVPPLVEIGAMLRTFLLVSFAWVFFMAGSFGEAFGVLAGIVSRPYQGLDYVQYLPLLGACFLLLIVEWLQREKEFYLQIAGFPIAVRWPVYFLCIVAILVFGAFGSNEFIYTQF
jgi:alginate O-acetyltransferase complex protein AlgI